MFQDNVFTNLLICDTTRYTTLSFYDWAAVDIGNQVHEGDVLLISHYKTRKPSHKSLKSILSPKIRLNSGNLGPMDVEFKIPYYHFHEIKKVLGKVAKFTDIPVYNFKTIEMCNNYAHERIVDTCGFILHIGRVERKKSIKSFRDIQRYSLEMQIIICGTRLENMKVMLSLSLKQFNIFQYCLNGDIAVFTNMKVIRNSEENTATLESTEATYIYKKDEFTQFQSIGPVNDLVKDLTNNPTKYVNKFNSEASIGGYLPPLTVPFTNQYVVMEQQYQIVALLKKLPLRIRTTVICKGIIQPMQVHEDPIKHGYIGYSKPQDPTLSVFGRSRTEILNLVKSRCLLHSNSFTDENTASSDTEMCELKLSSGGIFVENHGSILTGLDRCIEKYVIEIIRYRPIINPNIVFDGYQFVLLATFKPYIKEDPVLTRADTDDIAAMLK